MNSLSLPDAFLVRFQSLIAKYLEKGDFNAAAVYPLTTPGKLFRPRLVFAIAQDLGQEFLPLYEWAMAVEILHAATLVHDDLPAIDDDELRRGLPSCHVQYGEDWAILAGDGLIGLAFGVLARGSKLSAGARCKLISLLDNGNWNIAIGQAMDVRMSISDCRLIAEDDARKQLIERYELKTGALLGVAAKGVAIVNRPKDRRLQDALYSFGVKVGLLFQLADDLLELRSTTEIIGKDTSSDLRKSRATFPGVFGEAETIRVAEEILERGSASLRDVGLGQSAACSLLDAAWNRIK